MATYKSFTFCVPENHRHAVVIDAEVTFRLDILEFDSNTYIKIKVKALIDTGANCSCISTRVISACKLQKSTSVKLISAQGISFSSVYEADITLPNDIKFSDVSVMEIPGGSDFDVIIGMDILSQCDIALTNAQSDMCFSIRVPPAENHIDFEKITC